MTKNKWLQHKPGAQIYMIMYRRFTEIAGLGSAMQTLRCMNPDPIMRYADLERAIDKCTERNIKLESHGNQSGLAPPYKVIALQEFMAGKAKAHFVLWEAEHKHEDDCGFSKILDKVHEYSRKAKFESTAADQKGQTDMDCNTTKMKEDINKQKDN